MDEADWVARAMASISLVVTAASAFIAARAYSLSKAKAETDREAELYRLRASLFANLAHLSVRTNSLKINWHEEVYYRRRALPQGLYEYMFEANDRALDRGLTFFVAISDGLLRRISDPPGDASQRELIEFAGAVEALKRAIDLLHDETKVQFAESKAAFSKFDPSFKGFSEELRNATAAQLRERLGEWTSSTDELFIRLEAQIKAIDPSFGFEHLVLKGPK